MYRFEITHRSNGGATVTCGEHSATDARVLARTLTEAGMPDGRIEAGRAGRIDYRVGSLHAFAATTLAEGEKGFTRGIYQPYPPRDLHPALNHAISALRRARVNDSVPRNDVV